jgi:hypothetical protein
MTTLEKAKAQLAGIDIHTSIENDRLYVIAGYDTLLELSDFEVSFRADLYEAELEEAEGDE